ncbi:MAG TPA: mandelate racemase/muconate lactonizing enzyme family protein [Halococcus sp.]|nr:mandelate racemase/muconate lactonizing enzyme family protein [Halococcus sp.]
MEITDIRVHRLSVDLDRPLQLSRDRTIDSRAAAVVVVETTDGTCGVGEAVGTDPAIVKTIVEEKYAPRLVGESPLERERLWHEMLTQDLYWDRKGPGVVAASGVDIALWDLAGKRYGAPVCDLLGGDAHGGSVQAYASDLFFDEPEEMAERAAEYVSRGFEAVKCHLGRGREADEKRVAAMREAIGDAELMVDMNCGYTYPEAHRVGRMLEKYDVYWYEEPLAPHDVDGLTELRDALDVPIAAGENEFTKWGFQDLFEAGAVDYAMPDVMRCGGITEAKKVCALAEAFDVTPTPHNFATGVGLAATLHVMATVSACEWLEYDVTGFALFRDLLCDPPEVENGSIDVPTGPGLGIELDDTVLESTAFDSVLIARKYVSTGMAPAV